MRSSALKVAFTVLPLAFSSALTLGACKNGSNEPKVAHVKPGEMPTGARWDGVYFNPMFGNLHVSQTREGTITGRWKTADGTKWGELNGEAEGNVLHFEWIEHKVGLVGPSAESKGKGYFVYTRPQGDNVDDELRGEWGLDQSETGNEWNSVKQRNMKPEVRTIHGDEEVGGPNKEWK